MIAAGRALHAAVSSTNTGGLPGPAQIARLPVCIAALTTPGPPVTSSSRTTSCLQMRVEGLERRLLDDAGDVLNAGFAIDGLVVGAHGDGGAAGGARDA